MNEDKRTDILFDYQRPAMLSSLGLLTVLAALVAPDGIGFYFLVGALTVIALQSFHALRGWFRMKVQPLRLRRQRVARFRVINLHNHT